MHLSDFKLITDKISFFGCQSFILLSLLFFAAGFSLSAQTSPTVTLTDTDSDNLLSASDTVTITASFNEAMTATPTISITGAVTNVIMIPQNGLILKGNSSFWNDGEPNNDGSNENVAELSTNKVNEQPLTVSNALISTPVVIGISVTT